MIRLCALMFTLVIPSVAYPQVRSLDGQSASLQDDLLDLLVGKWDVRGTTHNTPTTQTLEVDWVLNHQFLRIYQKSSENVFGGSVPYEAILMVGYDPTSKNYVLHLMNIRGGGFARGIAVGRRTGNEISFVYYDIVPPGVNSAAPTLATEDSRPGVRFTWEPDSKSWHLVFGTQTAKGGWQTVTDVRARPLLAAQASAQTTADDIERKRAEQALPRVAVAFDPPMFDKYVGYYQLGPKAIFTISRDGDHFLVRMTRQPEGEIFPESAIKFFSKLIPAQISFNSDARGQVTGLVLHQGGREVVAPRIDEGLAKNIEASVPPFGHPMPRTWPMMAGVTPRFITSMTAGGVDYWPCFSPDGKIVLFSRTTDGRNWELVRVAASGGAVERFAQSPLPVSATRATWSHTTNQIAFTGTSAGGASDIWIVNGDGTGAYALTAPGLSDQMLYPSWYPDGKSLVATDARDLIIKRVNLAGGAATTVTDRARVLTGMSRVSPDGKRIAFAGQENAGQAYNQEENVIWLVNDAGALTTLEAKPIQGRTPAWSPDGQRLAFESNRGSADGRYAIFVINRDGTGLMQVTDYALNANHPVWSQDGRRMVFAATEPGRKYTNGIAMIDVPIDR
jgi:dipeptidyl aminopeptidase/acylaminoacyl peptidase